MRKPVIAGNFKMYKTINETIDYAKQFTDAVKDVTNVEIVIAPQALNILSITEVLKGTNIQISAQNVHWEDEGAFTGENSAKTLKSIGVNWTIIGHSERREYFSETDETVNKRIKNALKNNLKVIFCIGETLQERKDNLTLTKVQRQIEKGLEGITIEQLKSIVIAYEPIWAIGTGVTATKEQAQEVHFTIRQLLTEKFGKDISENMNILYGGSVKPNNIKELMSQPDIDGALVGGASLTVDSFKQIVKYYE